MSYYMLEVISSAKYTITRCEGHPYFQSIVTEIIENPNDISLINFYYIIELGKQGISFRDALKKCGNWWMISTKEEKDSYRLMMNLMGGKW